MLPLLKIEKAYLITLVLLVLMFFFMVQTVEIDFASFTLAGIVLSIFGCFGILSDSFFQRYKESKIIPIQTYFSADDEIIELHDEKPKHDEKSEVSNKFNLKFGGN